VHPPAGKGKHDQESNSGTGMLGALATFTTAAFADAITITYSVTTGNVGTIANKSGSPALPGGR
jgi:hypothetical protein